MRQKCKSLLSILLTICIIFTTFGMVVSAETQETPKAVYYVASGGTGDGSSAALPFGTVNAAINAAGTSGAATGEIIIVNIPEGDTVTWGGSIPGYQFKLVIQAEDTNADGTITQANISDARTFGGDVVFKNVKLSNTTTATFFNGKNVTFDEGSGFAYSTVIYGNDGGKITVPGQTIIYRGEVWGSTTFMTNNWTGGTTTYTDDLNVVVDNPKAAYGFRLNSNANTTTTYSEDVNLNFDIRQCAAGLSFSKGADNIFHNGAIQIVYKEAIKDTLAEDITALKAITPDNAEGYKGVYELVDATGINGDVISFVSKTAGKYKIVADAERYDFVATATDGTEYKAQKEQDGAYYITVQSNGKYTITATKKSETVELFVESGATNGDGTQGKPFADIGEAVSYAVNKEYTDGDKVTVTVIGTEIEWGTFPASYDFDLKIQTRQGETAANISLPADANFRGDTEFVNVNVIAGGSWPSRKVYFDGNDITFREDASLNTDYAIFGVGNANSGFESQTVIIDGTLSASTYVYLTNEWGNVSYSGDLYFKLDSANARITPHGNNGTTTFNNLNIDFGNTATAEFLRISNDGNFVINGALQMICKDSLVITNEELFGTNSVYKIINNTDFDNAFEFVPDTAGQYKIISDVESYDYIVKQDGVTVEGAVKDGYITLENAGTYTVENVKKAVNKELFVEMGATNGDGTQGKPFADIGEAVSYAVNKEYTDGDKVTVTIIGTEIEWGTVTPHGFDLIVKSQSENATVNAVNTLGGDTEFYNVTLKGTGTWPERNIFLDGHNAKFDENTVITDTDYLTYGVNSVNKAMPATQKVVMNGKISSAVVQMSNYYGSNLTFEEEVNLLFDYATSKAVISLNSHYGTTTFKKNINIDIKNATSYEYKDLGNAGGWTIEGALQLIHKEGLSVDGAALEMFAPADGVYEIVNATGFENLLEFVPNTAGKYKIVANISESYNLSKYKVVVVDENGVEYPIVTENDESFVDVSATNGGKFTVSIVKNAEQKEYFVKSGATDGNGSDASPFANIGEAVSHAVANDYIAGDTITVTILDDGNEGADTVDWGTFPESYSFDLIVQTKQGDVAANISLPAKACFVGDVEFANVVVNAGGAWPGRKVYFGGKNVTFKENANLNTDYVAYGKENETVEYSAQKVIIDGALSTSPTYIYLANEQSGTVTHVGDITTKINSSNGVISPSANSGSTTYNNVNIDFGNISTTKFFKFDGSFAINGALQLICKDGLVITDEELFTTYKPTNGVYKIINATSIENLFQFVEGEAGAYKVNTELLGKFYLEVKDSNGTVYPLETREDGQYIVVENSGTYTVSLCKEQEALVYYVKANAQNGDGSFAKPFSTVAAAVSDAKSKQLIKGDDVVIKVIGPDTVIWGELPDYSFSLTVRSADSRKATVDCTENKGLKGNVIFEDIIVKGSSSFSFNNSSVLFKDGATILGPSYLFLGISSGSQTIAAPKFEYSEEFSVEEFKLGNDWGGATFKGDLELVFNNASAYAYLILGGNNGTANYDNINLNLKNAAAAKFVKNTANTGTAYQLNGAIQIINSSDVALTVNDEELAKIDNSKKWLINNKSGINDLLSFVPETAGSYSFDANKYIVTVTDANGEETVYNDGEISLVAGTYSVTAQEKSATPEQDIITHEHGYINLSSLENVNLVVDNPDGDVQIDFADATYKNVKINVKNAKYITFSGQPTVTGSLQVIVDEGATVVGENVIEAVGGESWYIINTADDNAIGFTNAAGIFSYTGGYEVVATGDLGEFTPDGEEIRLLPGEYSFEIKSQEEAVYGTYIDNGNGLANSYAKLADGEKVNVAYYGGSVTAGTGSTDAVNKSWRGRVGQWIENTFPEADVNNINLAYGGTSTKFGSYRLNHELLTRKPDLLFIEFSINDYYDTNADEAVASMRFETIVRQVREALPECDIVTVLTTEVNLIENLWKGNIHSEAKGHETIARKYNLPILYVGRSLADDLKANYPNWSLAEYKASEDSYSAKAWAEYSTDIVHLTDRGYDVYYKTIEEFLTNNLVYGGYNGEVTKHSVPEMVSDSLLDGDIKYIDASEELLAKSEALGGSGYVYSSATGNLRGYQGYFSVNAGAESVFAIEFTGTELAVVEHSDDSLTSFMVKVDGGEYTTITPNKSKPVILATDLRYGEHTVYIKPVYSKGISWFQGFFVRNQDAQTVKTGEITTADYYVKNSEDQTEVPVGAKVYGTVAEAVSAAKQTGLKAGDIANIGVIGSTAVDWGTFEDYKFKAVVSSASTAVKSTVNMDNGTTLKGDVEFKNINVSVPDGWPNRIVNFDGYNVIFAEDTSFNTDYIFYGKGSGDASYGAQTVELLCDFPAAINAMNLSNNSNGNVIYNGDLTLKVNNNSFDEPLVLNSNTGSTTITGNLNLNFVRAASVTIKDGASSSDSTIQGALQLIINGKTTMNSKDFILGKKTDGNYWYITDNCLKNDLLGFTETAGVYTVANEGVTITATHTDGTVVKSQNGALDLSRKKGEWVLTSDYFEDFNSITDFEFSQDWRDTASKSRLENGKLIIDKNTYILNSNYQIQNNNLVFAGDMYFTFDFKGTDFVGGKDGCALIFAKLADKKGYGIYVSPDGLRLYKFETPNTLVTTGIDSNIPTTKLAVGNYSGNTYNPEHEYRFGFSFVGKSENEAYLRLILIDITTNTIMCDETYKDTQPYSTGTGIGFATQIASENGDNYNTSTAFDNFFASSTDFKEGSIDVATGDINFDGTYDIRDLVYADEYITDNTLDINMNMADKDYNDVIDVSDVDEIHNEILNNINVTEFSYKGAQSAQADEMRQSISNAADIDVTGKTVYYVSTELEGTDNGGNGTIESPWTLEQLNENRSKLASGNAVLFKRGDVFRLDAPYEYYYNKFTSVRVYVLAVEGVTYGAYGDNSMPKPLFKASVKDYTDKAWTKVSDNIWSYYAPEINVGNPQITQEDGVRYSDNGVTSIIFTKSEFGDRELLGERRGYVDGVYNLNRNGQFTYDTDSGKIYLYCQDGNPSDVYSSIEVGRATSGIRVPYGASNVVVDNLAFKGFGQVAVGGYNLNNSITVQNCEVGYCGGELTIDKDSQGNIKYCVYSGNAIGFWNGGKDCVVSNNWIYHTFDSAISPQGDGNYDYSGFTVTNNLLEYNNADIEFFDLGKSNTTDFSNWNISGNIMRFTSLGIGSRERTGIRGIEGVLKASTIRANKVGINFTNNIIDNPGRDIFDFNNATSVNDTTVTAIVKFNQTAGNTMSGNKYYINQTIRNLNLFVEDYKTDVSDTVVRRYATTKAEAVEVLGIMDSTVAENLEWVG